MQFVMACILSSYQTLEILVLYFSKILYSEFYDGTSVYCRHLHNLNFWPREINLTNLHLSILNLFEFVNFSSTPNTNFYICN